MDYYEFLKTESNKDSELPIGLKEIIYEKEIKREKYLKHIRLKATFEEIFLYKLKINSINHIEVLKKIIFEFIDNMIVNIEKKDREYFERYIEQRIILHVNEVAKNDNTSGICKLEQYSKYYIVKNLIQTKIETGGRDKEDIFINCKNSFASFIKKEKYTDINLLTISPIFLSYIFLCNKKTGYINEKREYCNIIKGKFQDYTYNQLMSFYYELNKFIEEAINILPQKGDKYKNANPKKYIKLGYDIFENRFQGHRISYIVDKMNEFNNINKYEKIKMILYASILLMVPDVDLSELKLKQFFKNYFINQRQMEKDILVIIKYMNLEVYNYIDELIKFALLQVNKKELINNLNDVENIDKYMKKHQNYLVSNDNKYNDEVLKSIKICNQYIEERQIIKQVFSALDIKTKKDYDQNSNLNKKIEALHIILGTFLEYRFIEM
ncbi:hypothetical protein EHW71_11885 [Clostridium butyricum]|jgi:hypothetical protein|uniref:hypothetical protein n=1 Tax=Clostridium butyricum TaxID=1492 RepID=UPI000F545810|nr:hypothetical protein [Clostridium butyricum]RQN09835.1 hypothetical protein EHW71_11885 [Clostridium butyricum]